MPAGNILVADDDAAIRTVLNQALSRAGYEVRSTGNAPTRTPASPAINLAITAYCPSCGYYSRCLHKKTVPTRGTSKFSVSIRREKQRQDSELKPHAGVFGYQREVVRTYCIKATRPE